MSSRNLAFGLGVMCIFALLSAMAVADVNVTITGSYVNALEKSIVIADAEQTEINVTAGMEFDPTCVDAYGNYDRVYLANRSGANAKRGLYSVTISTEAVSSRLAMAGDSTNDVDSPYDMTVGPNGEAYLTYSLTPSVWRVDDPSGTPVETQLLGNYNDTGDDDPISIDMMPANFGLAGYDSNDLVMFDYGMDNNTTLSLVAIQSDGSGHTVVWSQEETEDNNTRGDINPVDGKYYFTRVSTMSTVDVAGESLLAFYRVGSDATLETIAIDLPDGETVSGIDDAVVVNPIDGSLWFLRDDGNDARSVFRADTAGMTDLGDGLYVANATKELVATVTAIETDSFNAGTNGLAFSPDGMRLAIGHPSYVDHMSILSMNAVPEPSTWALILFGLGTLAFCRRK